MLSCLLWSGQFAAQDDGFVSTVGLFGRIAASLQREFRSANAALSITHMSLDKWENLFCVLFTSLKYKECGLT